MEALPQACISQDHQSGCQLTTQVRWRADQRISACLELAREPLHCWTAQARGEWQLTLMLDGVQSLQLIDPQDRRLYSELQLQVQVTAPKKTRRRLRAPWGLF